jgi:hypothetical protein
MTPADVRKQNVFPAGFLPLPHPHHAEGGITFSQFHIDEISARKAGV